LTTTCSFAVTVNDCEKPTISCPTSPITQCNEAGKCSAAVNFTVSATDNCPGVTTSCVIHGTSTAVKSGDTFPVGTTTVDCTATDAAGLTATCSFAVTVNDCEKPRI